jgi:hypothetical protein
MKTIQLTRKIRNTFLLFVLLSFVGCASISSFNQQAYTQTTFVKVDALNIMDLATDDYSVHENSVKGIQTQLAKIYEYEKNRPKNEITLKLWDKLLADDGHLFGGFIKRWENETSLNETFVTEAKKLVGLAFDQIAGLESRKIKESEVSF